MRLILCRKDLRIGGTSGMVLAQPILLVLVLLIFLSVASSPRVAAAETTIAVATNFKIPAESLIKAFRQHHNEHEVRLVGGSTGKLYAQIRHGAPFDVFLAADTVRPALLQAEGLSVPGSIATYAIGQLALLGHSPMDQTSLTSGNIRILALANPKLAPYGLAAQQTLQHLQIDTQAGTKLVYGENVGQVYTLVATGNADAGFVAHSSLTPEDRVTAWLVPLSHHAPIRQDALLLSRATGNPAAGAFLTFLGSETAASIIHSFGYRTDPS